ncbi:uncharacterized protein LOC119986918 [Tripterygium wilfordii]|uniref:uncharacterized protein LOC119986918 n=1 Tax=Tripterygium wilfordii TaxID=458696 RepID=UPI0018F854F6|nr:uncharacterized protein LOC119986918 [Tripterygium wilfordii]
MDEYIRIGETTTLASLKKFVKCVISVFGEKYSRSPTTEDLVRPFAIGQARGFPRMLGSIDCMHWKWKNCPSAWRGMYSRHVHEPTSILEDVASYDLWIWHAFFGMLGSYNDINVLERSTVFQDLAMRCAPAINYTVNGHNYTIGYYLADGIYPTWATFMKTIPAPPTCKLKHFVKCHESARKDVERAFGVLQARFAIMRAPTRFLKTDTLDDIMMACIILHNMIVEDERESYQQVDISVYDQINESLPLTETSNEKPEVMNFINRHHQIIDREVHSQL